MWIEKCKVDLSDVLVGIKVALWNLAPQRKKNGDCQKVKV